MTIIELDDDLAAALQVKAEAQHLKLEDWLRTLTGMSTASSDGQLRQAAASRIREISSRTKPDPDGWTVRDYIDRSRQSIHLPGGVREA
jgi:plasmid stability protein